MRLLLGRVDLNAGRFVGRVGGLAVALGIGAALGASPAWADDVSSGTSSGSASDGGTPASSAPASSPAASSPFGAAGTPEDSSKSAATEASAPESKPVEGSSTTADSVSAESDASLSGAGAEAKADEDSSPVNHRSSQSGRALRVPDRLSFDEGGARRGFVSSEATPTSEDHAESSRASAGSGDSGSDVARVSARAPVVDEAGVAAMSVAVTSTSAAAGADSVRAAAPEPVKPVAMKQSITAVSAPSTGLAGVLDGNSGAVSSLAWTMAAAARRELGTTGTAAVDPAAGSQIAAVPAAAAAVADDELSVLSYSTLADRQVLPPVVTPDGTRALVVTANSGTVRVAVFNTATGARIGATTALTGYVDSLQLTADGSRAVVSANVDSSAGVTATQRVAVINTATGKQIGTTVVVFGNPNSSPKLTADGGRAMAMYTRGGGSSTRVVAISAYTGKLVGYTDLVGSAWSELRLSADGSRALATTLQGNITRVAMINTATGKRVGSIGTLPGLASRSPLWSVDGSRAVVTTLDGDTTRILVVNAITGTQTASFTLPGETSRSVFLNADGSLALFTASGYPTTPTTTTRIAVVNTSTGAVTGSFVTVPGWLWDWPSALSLTADGSRAVVSTFVDDPVTGRAARVSVIDTATGAQVGATVAIDGWLSNGPDALLLTADGSRAVVTTAAYDAGTGVTVNRVAVINTVTGSQLGSTVTGSMSGSPLLSSDGTRVLLTATEGNLVDGFTAQSVVIDTSTGAQVGVTITVAGQPSWRLLTVTGSRAVIGTWNTELTVDSITRVAVIDMATGTQAGTTVTFPGYPMGAPQLLSADGSRAMVTTTVPGTGTYSHRVAMINTATGSQIGSTVTGSGVPRATLLLDGDGGRALIAAFVAGDPGTSAQATLLDTTTMTPIATVTGTGDPESLLRLNADGSRVLVTIDNSSAGASTTGVAFLQLSGTSAA